MSESPPIDLREVARSVAGAEVRGDRSTTVPGAAYDSRSVDPGDLFFCVTGARTDGHAHAGEAARAGAAACVVERWLGVDVPQIRVPSVRSAMGPMSAAVFGHPADALRIVGVTGTGGKTTSTYLLESVFREHGARPGVIGTLGGRIDGAPVPLERTTPEAPDLHRLLHRMRQAGVRLVAMEVSSHGLDQHRFDGIRCEVALFTNLTQDHLDHHGSMEDYFAAKARLFTPDHARAGAVNIDHPWGRRLAESTSVPTTTFGVSPSADVRATGVELAADGVSFRVGDLAIRSSLRGGFNVENCLGVVAVCRAMGISDATCARGIASLEEVPGRMQVVDVGQDFLLMVDYAHTPDSIRGVLRGARPLAAGRVIVVFGCGGDRDRDKRPMMGEAATSGADMSFITTDNPRSEDPLAIIDQIVPGARAGGGPYRVEPDRRAAIRAAVRMARAGDVVIVAGKGHETAQELAGRSVPFDDREVARQELVALGVDG